jgi:hypothetical protein
LGDIVTREKLELLCRFLHFWDNKSQDFYGEQEKLFKIFPTVSHLNSKFQTLYHLSQNISVDRSLTLWKGQLSFRQYLPLKSSQFCIKFFELYDPQTGCLWSLLTYTGKDTTIESLHITLDMDEITAIVTKQIEPVMKEGRTV